MTLSHCWGHSEFFKHTTKISGGLFAGIEIMSLPKTFRDAIYTTIQLNIKYLWIDSLCIIQDDHDDWLRESRMMGQVYQNGYCNIAATKAMAAAAGFLIERSPMTQSLEPPCYVASTWNNTANNRWHLSNLRKEHNSDYYLAGPLLQRGWVVQERLMAPRTLHFGSKQMYWECDQHDASECYPDGVPSYILAKQELPGFKHQHGNLRVCVSLTDAMEIWVDVVNVFSGCQLTMESDKLVALSGIASYMLERFPALEYLAGLWKDDLEMQLCWRAVGSPNTRPRSYRAPSWSWASLDGAISMNKSRRETLTSFIEVTQTVTYPLRTTGQLSRGHIRLTGPLLSVIFRRSGSTGPFECQINDQAFIEWSIIPDIDKGDDSPVQLHCLPIYANEDYKFDSLLLRPSDTQKGTFVRWGMAVLYYDDYGVPLVDGMPAWDQVKNEDWLEFEEDHGAGRYTITII